MAADPYAAAQALLTAFVDAWQGDVLPPKGARNVAEGAEMPWDGPQVTVLIGTVRPGLPSGGPGAVTAQQAVAFPVTVDLTVQVVRDRKAGLTHSGGRQSVLPSGAQEARAGAKAGGELVAMLNALLTIRTNGSVVSHPSKIAVNGARPVGPQGDLVGVEGTVAVLLGHD